MRAASLAAPIAYCILSVCHSFAIPPVSCSTVFVFDGYENGMVSTNRVGTQLEVLELTFGEATCLALLA
jgi:hypothetical protein